MLNKKDGAATKTIEERQERWTEWIKECFQTTPEKRHLESHTLREK